MQSLKIVVALGGNALGDTPESQLELVRFAADAIADIAAQGHRVIVGHGNGPQVGMIYNAMDFAAQQGARTPAMPFPECGAMSQGYIGYHLQQAIQQSLRDRGIQKDAATIVTQVVVSEQDSAFQNPTKPIGSFYSKEQAETLTQQNGYTYVEDAGRGYRRVVPSPVPLEIVELRIIQKLIEADSIVITVGGGGVPVIRTADARLAGTAAVIDKDRSCAKLADDLDADILMILTAVEKVCLRYGTPDQQTLDTLTVSEASRYIAEGHFAKGSMLPKIEACLDFVFGHPSRRAIVTSLQKAGSALAGTTGTVLTEGES